MQKVKEETTKFKSFSAEKKNMNNNEILEFFKKVDSLNLSRKEKLRLVRLFQVRGKNKVNKVMSFKEFTTCIKENKGKITFLALGPDWNRLVFVDIDVNL